MNLISIFNSKISSNKSSKYMSRSSKFSSLSSSSSISLSHSNVIIIFISFLCIYASLFSQIQIHCQTITNNNNHSNPNDPLSSKIEAKELLQLQLINKTVNYYKSQLTNVRTSLQDQLKEYLQSIKSIREQSSFQDPELQQKFNETFVKFLNDLQISPYCLASFNHLLVEIKEKRLWPLKFIDSMEFIPSGLLEGVMSAFGVYEECINIESPTVKLNDIRGKYCLAKVYLPFLNPLYPDNDDDNVSDSPINHNNHEIIQNKNQENKLKSLNDLMTYNGRKSLYQRMNRDFDKSNNKFKLLQMLNMFNGSYLRIGLCFPSTCSSFELERAINKFLDPINNPIRIEIEDECTYKGQEIELDNYQRLSIFILACLCLLVGACTGYEYYITNYRDPDEINKNSQQYDQYLLMFSALSNTRYLLGHREMKPLDENRLCSIDSITLAFVSMEFVGRSYVLPIFYGMINIKRALNGLTDQYFTAKKFFFIRGSSFAVTTYVLASSIILGFNICGQKSKIQPTIINFLKYALYRYLSIVRRFIGPILLIYLMPLLGDGPIWHYFKPLHVEPCKKNLWKTLLLINNYEDSMDKVCLGPSTIFGPIFYMSLFAPFLLYTLNHRFGYGVFIVLVVLGTIISVIPKFFFNLPITPYEISTTTSVAEAKLSFIHYYAATDQLIVVFVIGLFVGYLIRCKPKINLGKSAANIALWIGMLALPVISSQWNDTFKPLKGDFSQFNFMTWFLLCKIMWCMGFSWIIYSCCTGRANIFNKAITISLIRPMGKLAMGVYLNHITILGFRQLTKKHTAPLTNVDILTNDIADIVIAFVIAYIFYILIERPLYHVIKLLFAIDNDNQICDNSSIVSPTTTTTTTSQVKRFSMSDLENGKLNGDPNEYDLKPLNEGDYVSKL